MAKQCGTSVEMLERNFSFAIQGLEDERTQTGWGRAAPCPTARSRRSASSAMGRLSAMLRLGAERRAVPNELRERRLRFPKQRATRILQPRRGPKSLHRGPQSGDPCNRRRSSAGRALHS